MNGSRSRGAIRVRPGRPVRLSAIDPDSTGGFEGKDAARVSLDKDLDRLRERQRLLYADGRHALLVVLQAMDTGGKDGTIRHVLSGLNPVACVVTSFKVPSAEELAHDFLWRIHKAVPPHGVIGVFNRSHYEDVLVVRVHELVPPAVWKARYEQINQFERILSENGVRIVKIFLHISKGEQKRRLQQRLDNPEKNWKFSEADLAERKLWGGYMAAYEDAINRCSTDVAPWYVVPANVKWARDAMVGRLLRDTMDSMSLRRPKVSRKIAKQKIR
ncbi:MAG TPA: polyphosphate kinase 2 family protein [Candidatus Eisenbacteria bacterium]|nr:polyphosphate kinase 2 family protein [Candidatus Eisenbacteria bacterium]